MAGQTFLAFPLFQVKMLYTVVIKVYINLHIQKIQTV